MPRPNEARRALLAIVAVVLFAFLVAGASTAPAAAGVVLPTVQVTIEPNTSDGGGSGRQAFYWSKWKSLSTPLAAPNGRDGQGRYLHWVAGGSNTYWVLWSVRIDKGFPGRMLNFHDVPGDPGCGWGQVSPVALDDFDSGRGLELVLEYAGNLHRTIVASPVAGRWYDVALRLTLGAHDRSNPGSVTVWLDGQPSPVVDLANVDTLNRNKTWLQLWQGAYDCCGLSAEAQTTQTAARIGTSIDQALGDTAIGQADTPDAWSVYRHSGTSYGDSHKALAAPARTTDDIHLPGSLGGSPPTATFGRSTVGAANEIGGAHYLDVSGPYATPAASSASRLVGYLAGGSTPSTIRGVVYADAGGRPGAPIAVSSVVTLAARQAAGWVELPLPSAVVLPAGVYWLGYWYGAGGTRVFFDRATGSERYAPMRFDPFGPEPAFPAVAGTSESAYSLHLG